MHEFGIFIGRFQPFHNAHLEAVRFALSRAKGVIIVLGSDCSARTIKNPWTSGEREEMIRTSLSVNEEKRIKLIFAKDYLYNDNLWITAVQQKVDDLTLGSKDVVLFGHKKDRSSFYLKLFPQWKFIDFGDFGGTNATMIRDLYFAGGQTTDFAIRRRRILSHVPESVFEFMNRSRDKADFMRLKSEHDFIEDYKRLWRTAPYPPAFITTDAVVIRSGHILVVRRKGHPGKGLVALPGGFLKQSEHIVTGCLRELKEETGIKLPKAELQKMIVDEKVFDHPERSLRGRTITHAFCIDLGHGTLPKVKGADDADKAWWMPLRDLDEDVFFEDHFHIINYFVSRF